MELTLEVTGPQAAKLGAAARRQFGANGGTIGRLRENTWTLSDPWVSARHARITFAAGTFYIEDTSTNGVFVNSPDNRLIPGRPYALKPGDAIFIDPYEIHVSISEAESTVGREDDPFGLDDLPAAPVVPRPAAPPPPPPASLAAPVRNDFGLPPVEDDDWLEKLGGAPAPPPADVPKAANLAGGSLIDDFYRPPSVQPAAPSAPPPPADGSLIPDDWLSDDRPSSSLHRRDAARATPASRPAGPPAPPPASRGGPAATPEAREEPSKRVPPAAAAAGRGADRPAVPPAGSTGAGLDAVLAGAGLEGLPVTPELAQHFGEILRVVVAGVMDILQARQRIKSEFRMEMTTFKPAQNNPLKFSANVEDALHNLLVKRNAAYLGPVAAFEDAFDDLRNHQMATLAGVRVAFDAMLAAFDPDALQERFDRDVRKGALLNMPGKLRYWDQYCERIRGMVQDSETTFRELFGEAFATAYEEQLARLKAEGRARKR
jgi:type VI secretion system FHA domain protein